MKVYEYTDPDVILLRFRTKTEHRPAHVDVVLSGAFIGLNARNIQRALHLPKHGGTKFVQAELVLRRKV